MKKLLSLFLILTLLLCACASPEKKKEDDRSQNDISQENSSKEKSTNEENNQPNIDTEEDISQYIVKEGKYFQYIILPTSKQKASVYGKYEKSLKNTSFKLLTEAEKRILESAKKYDDKPVFMIEIEEDGAYLSAEIIVRLDPSDPKYGKVGCGDHDHVMFREPISKQ